MKKIYDVNIDWGKVSEGLGLPKDVVIEWFKDGRRLGSIGEYYHEKIEGGKRQKENSKFDVLETENVKSEVRAITDKVSFASSKEVGYGRQVTEEGFNEKLNSIDRYILVDPRNIIDGQLSMIEITKEDVYNLKLGKNKSISSKKFFNVYDRIESSI
jgi:hypothetical protein